MIESLVAWWCALLGVTNPTAIHAAVGVVAGGLTLGVAYLAFSLLIGVVVEVAE
jgi:hypothetical protein